MERESMAYDVVVVGGGPAGLATAIQYAKLCQQHNKTLSICVLEKGSEVGAHILSGAVIEPRALDELLPKWRETSPPTYTPVTQDSFKLLTKKRAISLPTPPQMNNHGNVILSLSQLTRWLGTQAEALGVDIFPGFSGKEFLFNDKKEVIGIITGNMGVAKNGEHKANFQPGMALQAKQVALAEGCRGSLTEQAIAHYQLRGPKQIQSYGLGLKELWQVDPKVHRKGHVIHTIGWPLDRSTYGGSFVYHWGDNLLSLGLVVGLDYQNPYLSPYDEFQRLKLHPFINNMLKGGQVISYGARALNEGGWQSIPKLQFPGGVIVGAGAGFMNVAKIKGSHTAMKSGMLAGEALFQSIHLAPESIIDLTLKVKTSWVGQELKKVRNIRPAFHKGLWCGLLYSALDTYLFHGHAPWTFKHQSDHLALRPAKHYKPMVYPKPDGIYTFDKMTSVSRTNVFHEEDQPSHLLLKDVSIPVKINFATYAGPEQHYCPAGVYEYVGEREKKLQINAQNCIHCKTCDIKDPKQNIQWVPPEGGGGPNYGQM